MSAPNLSVVPPARSRDSREIVIGSETGELFFAVVGPVGAGNSLVSAQLQTLLASDKLPGGPFSATIIKASEVIADWAEASSRPYPSTTARRLENVRLLQDLGDKMRRDDPGAVASGMVARIRETRSEHQTGTRKPSVGAVVPNGARRAFILDSLKNPAEVQLLRRVYGSAFTLIGVVCLEDERLHRLTRKYEDAGEIAARKFMDRDARDPDNKNGQRVLDAFYEADFFVDNSVDKEKKPADWNVPDELARLVDLLTSSDSKI